jgi:hypothetical protein
LLDWGLLEWGLLGWGLLGWGLLGWGLLGWGLLGTAVRPVGRGVLVEAELLPGSFRCDTAARGVA